MDAFFILLLTKNVAPATTTKLEGGIFSPATPTAIHATATTDPLAMRHA
jgi:hypothetical protein